MSFTSRKSSKSIVRVVFLTLAVLLSIPYQTSGEHYGVRDDQHPYVVHLEINGDPRSVTGCCPRCSGVLISLKHVATVATCLWSAADAMPKPKDIQIYAGKYHAPFSVDNMNGGRNYVILDHKMTKQVIALLLR